MHSTSKVVVGRIVLSVIAIFTIVAPFLADWNETHIYNPLWPPHAKYHNAQTMVLVALLGFAVLFFTWRQSSDTRRGLLSGLVVASLYWASQPIAFLFPGVGWTDPELLREGQSLSDFPIQLGLDLIIFALLAVVGWLFVSGTRDLAARQQIEPLIPPTFVRSEETHS